jgi:hypothetical protein
MDVWARMKWFAKMGAGIGVQRRFVQVILGRAGHGSTNKTGVMEQFMRSAAAVVTKIGPAWANKEVWGRPVGVWVLLICWLATPIGLCLTLAC